MMARAVQVGNFSEIFTILLHYKCPSHVIFKDWNISQFDEFQSYRGIATVPKYSRDISIVLKYICDQPRGKDAPEYGDLTFSSQY